MAFTYSATAKTARLQGVVSAIDVGGGGRIEILAGATILATILLNATSGTVSGSVLTLSGFPKEDSSADNTGTADGARIRRNDGTDIITGLSVGTSGTDVIIDNTSIVAGQTVRILASPTITHA